MIRALYQLGKYSENINSSNDGNDIVLDELNVDYVLLLEFNETGKNFLGVSLEEFDEDNRFRYLYKKGSPRGGDITPTSIYFKDDKSPDKSFNRYLQSLKKVESDIFKIIDKFFSDIDKKREILEMINKKIENKKKYALSLKIGENYLNQIPEVKNLLGANTQTKYSLRDSFPKNERVSKAQDKVCYVCQKQESVNGFTNTFQFYTFDKPGFMTGGFNRKFAWKNYPVCDSCGGILEKGSKFLRDNFRDNFLGLSYFIIPNFLFDVNLEGHFRDYKRIINRITDISKITLSNQKQKGLMKKEDGILELASKIENNLNFNIMFFDEQNAEFKIRENIEDIFPSRLQELYTTKNEIENTDFYKEFDFIPTKKSQFNFEINFYNLKKYLNSEEKFLAVIHSVYSNKFLDEKFIIGNFIEKIRNSYTEDINNFSGFTETIESLMYLKFFKKLNLFRENFKGEIKSMIEKTEKNSHYLEFLERHREVLDSDLKIGIFLEGILTQNLLSQPEQESKSFYNRLNGLKISEKIAKRLLPELINKFNEYGKGHYNNDLKEMISEYLLNADFKELSNDEMSYYFVLGMNMGKRIKKEKIDEELI